MLGVGVGTASPSFPSPVGVIKSAPTAHTHYLHRLFRPPVHARTHRCAGVTASHAADRQSMAEW